METYTKEQRLEKIRARQLARMMSALREVSTPMIVQQAVERHFNYFFEDTKQLIKGTKDQNDKSNKQA